MNTECVSIHLLLTAYIYIYTPIYIFLHINSEMYHVSSWKTWRMTFVSYLNGFRATCNFKTLILHTKSEHLSSEFWEETLNVPLRLTTPEDFSGGYTGCKTNLGLSAWLQWSENKVHISFQRAVKPADKRRRNSANTKLQYWSTSQNVCVKMEDVRVPQNWSQSNMIALWWLVAHFYLQPQLLFLQVEFWSYTITNIVPESYQVIQPSFNSLI